MSFLKKTRLHSLTKRAFTLLEVLIAFSLVVLCVLPLIYPHSYIFKETKQFVNEIHLDRHVGALHADLLNHLYQQKIAWEEIERSGPFPITEELLKSAKIPSNFPWKGMYWFAPIKDKSDKEDHDHVYRHNLVFSFLPKGNSKEITLDPPCRVYNFPFVLQRKSADAPPEQIEQSDPKSEKKPNPKKKQEQASED